MKYPIEQSLQKYKHIPFPFSRPMLALANIMLRQLQKTVTCPEQLKETQISIPRASGGEIRVSFIQPKHVNQCQPALIYLHGGAFILESADLQKKLAYEYAKAIQGVVLFVHYRLAPKYRFPAGFDDAYEVSEWLFHHAADYNIDQERVIIGGDSAGANLAVATLLKRRNLERKQFCSQFLIYPVLDYKQQTASMQRYRDTPLWNSKWNSKMWELYLPEHATEQPEEYFSPLAAKNFVSLPQAYIEVAEFDCLHDEGLEYAKMLQEANIEVEVAEVSGVTHGFEIEWNQPFVQSQLQRRCQILRQLSNVIKTDQQR